MLLCILKSATIAWILAHTTMNVAIIISELMTAFKLNTDKEVEVFEKFARYPFTQNIFKMHLHFHTGRHNFCSDNKLTLLKDKINSE